MSLSTLSIPHQIDALPDILIARQLMVSNRCQLMLAFLADEQSVGDRIVIDRLLYGVRRGLPLVKDFTCGQVHLGVPLAVVKHVSIFNERSK